jgi:acyl-CoA synthetase (NDP forming)
MISQSERTREFVRSAARRGIRFSKVVSYGNASNIGESELLGYLADDPENRDHCLLHRRRKGRTALLRAPARSCREARHRA